MQTTEKRRRKTLSRTIKRGEYSHRLKNLGAFPSDEAIYKVLFLGLQNVAKKWPMPIGGWKVTQKNLPPEVARSENP